MAQDHGSFRRFSLCFLRDVCSSLVGRLTRAVPSTGALPCTRETRREEPPLEFGVEMLDDDIHIFLDYEGVGDPASRFFSGRSFAKRGF